MTVAEAAVSWDRSPAPLAFAGPALTGLLACQHADEQFGLAEGLRQAGVRIAAHARHIGVRYLTATSSVGQRLVAAALLAPAAAGFQAPVWGPIEEDVLLVDGHVGSVIGLEVAADRLRSRGAPTVHGLAWVLDDAVAVGPSESALTSVLLIPADA